MVCTPTPALLTHVIQTNRNIFTLKNQTKLNKIWTLYVWHTYVGTYYEPITTPLSTSNIIHPVLTVWELGSCPERFIGYTMSVLVCIDNQVLPDNTIGFLSSALWWTWRHNKYWLSTVLNPVLTYPIIPNPYWSTDNGALEWIFASDSYPGSAWKQLKCQLN